MSKMYTLDNKLLVGTPEIRIGEKIYPVDDRVKTVKKIMEISKDRKDRDEMGVEDVDKIFDLAFGTKNAKEINAMDLSFAAYQELATLVMSAMTGEEPKDPEDSGERFQKPIEQSK